MAGLLTNIFRSLHNPAKDARLTYSQAQQPDRNRIQEDLDLLEKILRQNILGFWREGILDLEDGGYRLNHDLNGVWQGRSNKRLVDD